MWNFVKTHNEQFQIVRCNEEIIDVLVAIMQSLLYEFYNNEKQIQKI